MIKAPYVSTIALLFLVGCATGVKPPIAGTTVAEGKLLSDTMAVLNLQQTRHNQDGCSEALVEKVTQNRSGGNFEINREGGVIKGEISEVWTLNRCGKLIKYLIKYTPDGAGGSFINSKELE